MLLSPNMISILPQWQLFSWTHWVITGMAGDRGWLVCTKWVILSTLLKSFVWSPFGEHYMVHKHSERSVHISLCQLCRHRFPNHLLSWPSSQTMDHSPWINIQSQADYLSFQAKWTSKYIAQISTTRHCASFFAYKRGQMQQFRLCVRKEVLTCPYHWIPRK